MCRYTYYTRSQMAGPDDWTTMIKFNEVLEKKIRCLILRHLDLTCVFIYYSCMYIYSSLDPEFAIQVWYINPANCACINIYNYIYVYMFIVHISVDYALVCIVQWVLPQLLVLQSQHYANHRSYIVLINWIFTALRVRLLFTRHFACLSSRLYYSLTLTLTYNSWYSYSHIDLYLSKNFHTWSFIVFNAAYITPVSYSYIFISSHTNIDIYFFIIYIFLLYLFCPLLINMYSGISILIYLTYVL